MLVPGRPARGAEITDYADLELDPRLVFGQLEADSVFAPPPERPPGVDPEATPACVNSCISGALAFGDADDPGSNVSQLLRENRSFRMHEELGTGPNFHYLWDGDKPGKP